MVDRIAYKGIGSTTQLDGLNFGAAIDTVKRHEAALEAVYKELLAIESIFPARIVNSDRPRIPELPEAPRRPRGRDELPEGVPCRARFL